MQHYQERVVVEFKDLCDKIDKLALFIGGEQFNSVDFDDRQLLTQQFEAMLWYKNILLTRINRFSVDM